MLFQKAVPYFVRCLFAPCIVLPFLLPSKLTLRQVYWHLYRCEDSVTTPFLAQSILEIAQLYLQCVTNGTNVADSLHLLE